MEANLYIQAGYFAYNPHRDITKEKGTKNKKHKVIFPFSDACKIVSKGKSRKKNPKTK